VLGAVLGATGALAARGEARATLLDLRQWSAQELRRLEHKPQSALVAESVVVASIIRPIEVQPSECDCKSTPAPGSPCAALLAPFAHAQPVAANDVPSVRIEDLPRVHPPTVARRHHGHRAPAAPPPDPPADADEEASPAAPPALKPENPAAPDPRAPLGQTAANDTRW
jgi:hypothetical protein